jgi:hypothetical protein
MPGGQLGLFGPRHRQDAFVLSRKGDDETEHVSWVRPLTDGGTPWHWVWISTTSSDRPGGEFDLGWLRDTSSEWGIRAKPGKTGLTLRDIAIGSYGEVPDHAPLRTMARRGSDIDPDVPDMGYTINDKSEVWSDNLLEAPR